MNIDGNIIVIADVHISDYLNRTPYAGYRLEQTKKVAQNIIKTAAQNNCKVLMIAGDLLERAISDSEILYEAKVFLETMSSYFQATFIIWGNHDLSSRNLQKDNISSSAIGTFLPGNVYYSHQKTIQINNSTFAFSNYQISPDLSWITTPVDFLVSHVTVNYDGYGPIRTQRLDDSKFGIGIFGDIHRAAVTPNGKYVSVGIPQRCKLSDSPECTGVVINPTTKEWGHVGINPDDNLMKLELTGDITLDNFFSPGINTIYVYDDKLNPNINSEGAGSIISSNFGSIENLFVEVMKGLGLGEIHNMVASGIGDMDSEVIDFGFKIKSIEGTNFRSISHIKLDFSKGDKIRIKGKNGAGKTSLFGMIMLALADSKVFGLSSLKSFIKFGAKDCKVTVEFDYKNHSYRLTRGTSEYGLSEDGIDLAYVSKTFFEQDCRYRFPFIEYLDIFKLDADKNQLFGKTDPEKLNKLISKFMKFTQIDVFNAESEKLLANAKEKLKAEDKALSGIKTVLDNIEAKVSTMEVPAQSLEELWQIKTNLEALGEKARIWDNYYKTNTETVVSLETKTKEVEELKKEISQFRDPGLISQDRESKKLMRDGILGELTNLGNVISQRLFLTKEISSVIEKGIKMKAERDSLKVGGICKTCGHVLDNQTAIFEKQRELDASLTETRSELTRLQEELGTLPADSDVEGRRNELMVNLGMVDNEISRLDFELANQNAKKLELDKLERAIKELGERLSQNMIVPEKVELPPDYSANLTGVVRLIELRRTYDSLVSEKAVKQMSYVTSSQKVADLTQMVDGLGKYKNATSPTGEVYAAAFDKLAAAFSDNTVTYRAECITYRGVTRLSLKPYYNNSGNYVEYEAASNGQKTVMDIHLLKKLINNVGILILDEFLSHLDQANLEACIDDIKKMDIGLLMIVSHTQGFPQFENREFELELDGNGETQINVLC